MAEERENGSVSERVIRGTLWMGAWRWTARLIGFISTVILARLLLPEDFGIVAMGLVVIAFFDILIDLGTDRYLIRLEQPDNEDYNTAWSLRLLIILCISVIIFLVSEPIARYFGDARLAAVLQVLLFSNVLRGFVNIGLTLHRRNLQFKKIAMVGLGQRFAGFIATVVLAFVWESYWAMVVGEIVARLTELVLSYVAHPYRPRFSLSRCARQFHFSKWLLVRNLANFLQGKADQLVVAKFFGTAQIGLYAVGNRIAELPTKQLMAPMLFPVYSGLATRLHDPDLFAKSVLKVLGATFAIALPTAMLVATLSQPIVVIVLGVKWLSAVPLLGALVFIMTAQVLIEPATTTLMLRDRVRLEAALQWASALTVVTVLLTVAQQRDIIALVWARAAVAILFVFFYYTVVRHVLSLTVRAMIGAIYRPVAACGLMAVVTWSVAEAGLNSWLTLIAGAFAGGISYIVTLYLLWRLAASPDSGEAMLARQVTQLTGRFFKRLSR